MDRRLPRLVRRAGASSGVTLVDTLMAASIVALLAVVAVPQAVGSIDRSRAFAAARYLAARIALAKAQAAMRAANVALRFEDTAAGVTFAVFVDGNGNGVRARDIASGIDRPLDPPMRLADMFPGVSIAVSDVPGTADPVRIGPTSFLSFSPLGTATPGTVYVRGRDGSQLSVRVLGATARTRVLRYMPRTREWVAAF